MNIMWFLNSLRILYKYEAIESSKFEFLEKKLLEAEDNTSGPLDGGGIACLPLLRMRTLLAIRQRSLEPSFWYVVSSFVLLA